EGACPGRRRVGGGEEDPELRGKVLEGEAPAEPAFRGGRGSPWRARLPPSRPSAPARREPRPPTSAPARREPRPPRPARDHARSTRYATDHGPYDMLSTPLRSVPV